MVKATIAFALVLAATLGTACVKQEIATGAGVGPSLVVEQFMRAANAAVADRGSRTQALETLGRLFGTSKGPITKSVPASQVEQRMFAIATELRHTDFEITGESLVPGRASEATRLMVRLTVDDKKYNVPFTLVRYKSDSWLIEQIGLEVLTAPRK